MTNREIALEYVRCFCEVDIHGFEKLLAPNLKFEGPVHSFDSAADFIAQLRSQPPEKSPVSIISITESADSAAAFFNYHRGGKVFKVAQLFNIAGQKISATLLIFDTGGMG